MRLPLLWLHDYCDPGLPAAELAERLTMTGTQVERIFAHGVTALENFVVGRVLTAEQHPNADRLTVCTVAVGEGDTSQIVCGAPNVRAGQTVAVGRPGAAVAEGAPDGRRPAADIQRRRHHELRDAGLRPGHARVRLRSRRRRPVERAPRA